MTTVADLVTAFHDIDALKGRVCGKCKFMWRSGHLPGKPAGIVCRKAYRPADETDGCDDWQPKHNPDRATMAVVMSV
jgi:hypothetical protein